MDKKMRELYDLLTSEYQTSSELSKKIHFSSKTTRKLLNELALQINGNGATIECTAGHGCRMIIQNKSLLAAYWEKKDKQNQSSLPNSAEERVAHLTQYFLTTKHYVKLEELSENLFVSKKTLSFDLKSVEQILKKYNLFLERRPKYGIKICGSEFDIRICLADQLNQSLYKKLPSDPVFQGDLLEVAQIVNAFLHEEKFELSEFALQNLILHIYISFERMKHNCFVTMSDPIKKLLEEQEEIRFARKIMGKISQKQQIKCSEDEIFYIGMHLSGKRSSAKENLALENSLIIRTEIISIVNKMMDAVNSAFHVDFTKNLEMQMQLASHLVPLIDRIQFGIHLKNPLIDKIKKDFSFAFALASTACTVLTQHYGKDLDEDEIGYIALIFALDLEENHQPKKMNVLLVCASGKSSAHLLKILYEKSFKSHLDKMVLCSLSELETFDLQEFDYIFTTVPIYHTLSIPILEVNYFLEPSNIESIKNTVFNPSFSKMQEYYKEDLFFSMLDFTSKESLLKFLCHQIEKHDPLVKNMYESVMRRENLAGTQFGDFFAIPHPYEAMGEKTLVAVGILKEPIPWDSGSVQVVFLISFGNEKTSYLSYFYDTTSEFLLNAHFIQDLIQHPNYTRMIENFELIQK